MAHILLVEDDTFFADICAANLEDLGHRVALAANGLMALDQLKDSDFDLVITDYQMPFVNGVSLIDSIRRLDGHSRMPVILMSGALPCDIEVDGLPIQGFLAKPFEHDVMVALIGATLAEAAHLPHSFSPTAW